MTGAGNCLVIEMFLSAGYPVTEFDENVDFAVRISVSAFQNYGHGCIRQLIPKGIREITI